MELIDLLQGKFAPLDVPYDFIMDNENPDDVVKTYKGTGFIISGLLLGYPLEATANLIEKLMEQL